MRRISQFPEMSPIYLGKMRRQVITRSHYGIFYAVEPLRIMIVYIMDLRQDEHRIRQRLSNGANDDD